MYNFRQGPNALDESDGNASRISAPADAVQHITGIFGNYSNQDIWKGKAKERENRAGFYNATNTVDYYFSKNWIQDKHLQNGQGRTDITNFITDGTLPTGGINTKQLSNNQLEYSLRIIYTATQIMATEGIKAQPELEKKFNELNEADKKAGEKINFAPIADLIKNEK